MKASEIKDIIVIEVPHQKAVTYHIYDDMAEAKAHDYDDLYTVMFLTLEEAVKVIEAGVIKGQHQGAEILLRVRDAIIELLSDALPDEAIDGMEEDEDGYMQETYNLKVRRWKVGAVDLIVVEDNGDHRELEAVQPGVSTQDYLLGWDDESVKRFRAENLIS